MEREGAYLRFTARNLIVKASASSEDITELSKAVGVGCGLFALSKVLKANVNRFVRFKPGDKVMRRMDFEFYVGSRRYFHEAKGTTSRKKASANRAEIRDQKKSTIAYCRTHRPKVSACTGSIVLYRKSKASAVTTGVSILDPPTVGDSRIPESSELLAVLNYYRNIYAVTHSNFDSDGRIGIAAWLSVLLETLLSQRSLPTKAPEALSQIARVREVGPNGAQYAGTIFDARLTHKSVTTFSNFAEATEKTLSPIRFVGVRAELTHLIVSCRWRRTLTFRDRNSSAPYVRGTVILASGVMVRDLARTKSRERESQFMFESMKSRLQSRHS